MRQISPRLLCLALPFLAIFVLTACGHGSPTATAYVQRSAPSAAAASVAASSAAASTASKPPGISGGPSVAPGASAAPAASAAPSGDGGLEQGPVDSALAAEQSRLLIKTG